MDSGELIELFFNRSYEKFVNKQILDDKNYIVPRQQLTNYVYELVSIPYSKFIYYIKGCDTERILTGTDVTQFSTFEACEIEMCEALIWANNPGCQFLDIGRMFPKYVHTRNDIAYRKYGENHIKTATQLGLAFEYYDYWFLSCLGYIYPDLNNSVRKKLLARNIIRNPLYQQMMLDILERDISSVTYMNMLSEKTIRRRQHNVCTIFRICIDECSKEGIKIHNLIEDSQKKNISLNEKFPQHLFPNSSHLAKIKLINKGAFPDDDVHTLIARIEDGDKEALTKLVKICSKLIDKIARLYVDNCDSYKDLYQDGVIALILAVRKYRHYYDYDFFDLAKFYINYFITCSLGNYLNLLKVPQRPFHFHLLLNEFRDKYYQINEFEPSLDKIELDENVSPEYLQTIYELPSNLNALSEHTNCDEFSSDDSFSPDNNLMQESLKYDVLRLVYSLPEREGDILINFYGLNGKVPQTLEEIGDLYGLTRERVRQIKEKAQRKLRIFLKVLKDEEIEEKASIKAMESRWKSFPGNQFSSFNFTNTESKTKENKTNANKIKENKTKPLNKSTDLSTTYLRRINTSHHYKELKEFLSCNPPQPLIKNRDNKPSELKTRLLQILKEHKQPMSLQDIYTEVNNKYFSWHIRIESVEYVLREISEIECTKEGVYRLRSAKQSVTYNTTKPEPCVNIEKPTRELEEKHEFTLSTPLYQLAKQKILTIKQVKQCRRKGLDTINDVYLMIQKHHLTPTSTRFTDYTISMWFKIVGLVKSDTNIKPSKEVSIDDSNLNYEDIYEKYTHKMLKMHQAKEKGRVIVAKPILLLSVINGIDEGIVKYNRIILGDWLVYRYNTLMSTYNNGTSVTEINMPFWYLKNDGFWHIHFIDDPKEKVYTPSMKWLNDNVEFASLDNELWLLLQNEKWRTKIRDFILGYKLSEKGTTITSRKLVRKKTSTSTSLSPKKNIIQDDLYDTQSNEPWTAKQEKSLTYFFNQGKNYETLAKLFGRSEMDVRLCLIKLGLI